MQQSVSLFFINVKSMSGAGYLHFWEPIQLPSTFFDSDVISTHIHSIFAPIIFKIWSLTQVPTSIPIFACGV